jgi:hypothetical protein
MLVRRRNQGSSATTSDAVLAGRLVTMKQTPGVVQLPAEGDGELVGGEGRERVAELAQLGIEAMDD